MRFCNIVTEDELSLVVIQAILKSECPNVTEYHSRITNGFGQMKKNIRAYNKAARAIPYIVLTDLDKTECPPNLIRDWLGNIPKHRNLYFRVAVREVESWLLAHRQGFSDFLGINISLIPPYPDQLKDPKRKLIELAKRSRRKALRDSIIPFGTAAIGPDYNGCLGRYVQDVWNVPVAQRSSESLARTVNSLRRLT